MKLGLYQCPSPAGDLAAGLARVDEALGEATKAGVDMLTLPEMFLPGYNADPTPQPEAWPQVQADLAALVAQHGIGLTIGLADYQDTGIGNAAFAFGRDGGLLAVYHKVQLFGPREKVLYVPGDRLLSFDFEGVTFGLLVCYDVEFPEHTRALARAGAQALLVPTANMMPFVNVNEVTVPARALESGLTVVYANYCGVEGDLTYTGRSLIVGPDGRTLATMGEGSGLIVADLPAADGSGLETPVSTQFEDYRVIDRLERR